MKTIILTVPLRLVQSGFDYKLVRLDRLNTTNLCHFSYKLVVVEAGNLPVLGYAINIWGHVS